MMSTVTQRWVDVNSPYAMRVTPANITRLDALEVNVSGVKFKVSPSMPPNAWMLIALDAIVPGPEFGKGIVFSSGEGN